MKCPNCGGPKMASRKQSYQYSTETGLPVTLAGIEVLNCPDCGEGGPVIPRPLELYVGLVGVIARKTGRLAGAEVTFLRKALDRNGRELARLMGCTPTVVSRWEGDKPMNEQADKLLRLATCVHMNVPDYTISDLENAASEDVKELLRITMVNERGAWKLAGDERRVA